MNEEISASLSRTANARPISEETQEIAWIHASKCGDALSFNRLALKWERTMYNVALRMLQNPEEAADATQEVFLLAFKNVRNFKENSRFSTWLYRIAVNHCISRARQRPPGAHLSLDDETCGDIPAAQLHVAETQDVELIRAEQRNRVLAALSHLTPEQRAVVELKFFEDMIFEDISEILGIPLSTVKSRLYAGLEMLKVRLSAGV